MDNYKQDSVLERIAETLESIRANIYATNAHLQEISITQKKDSAWIQTLVLDQRRVLTGTDGGLNAPLACRHESFKRVSGNAYRCCNPDCARHVTID